ncbi:MAG: hypothetical protein QXE92_03440 [Thermofilaceae archaeon]
MNDVLQLVLMLFFAALNLATFAIRVPILKLAVALFTIALALMIDVGLFYLNAFLVVLAVINIYDAAVRLR